MDHFYQFLADHQIEYERHDDPLVYTVICTGLYGPPLQYFMEKGLWTLRNKKVGVIVEDTDYGRG